MSRKVRKKMKATKGEWVKEQCKNIEKVVMSGNSKEGYSTLEAFTKTQQLILAVINDSSEKVLTESTAFLIRWTEYYSGLYIYEFRPDSSLLQSNQTFTQDDESLAVLREDVEEAVRCLKAGKCPGVDHIPSELLNNESGATTVLKIICQKILVTMKWPKEWAQLYCQRKTTPRSVRTVMPSA